MKIGVKFLNTILNVQRIERAIPIEVQRAMYFGNVIKSFSLNSSHTPNFSQPKELANIHMNLN